jgi:catechol 2,3-dioxygenase-like lactoylglutathione lyase family enzyme
VSAEGIDVGIVVRGLCPLISVFDMPASLRFYRDVLGFDEVAKSGQGDDVGWARLCHGGEACLMLNTAYDTDERPERPDPARAAAHGDTILYLGCEDLDGAYDYLIGHGVPADRPEVAPYGMKQVYATDPDGYKVCLQWPTEGRRSGGD